MPLFILMHHLCLVASSFAPRCKVMTFLAGNSLVPRTTMMVLGAPLSFCSCLGYRRLLLRRSGLRLDPKVCDGEHQCCHEEHAADSPSHCRVVGEPRNTRQVDRCNREEEQCCDGALPCCGWSVRYRCHACVSFPVASRHRSGTARRRRRLRGRPRQGCAAAVGCCDGGAVKWRRHGYHPRMIRTMIPCTVRRTFRRAKRMQEFATRSWR